MRPPPPHRPASRTPRPAPAAEPFPSPAPRPDPTCRITILGLSKMADVSISISPKTAGRQPGAVRVRTRSSDERRLATYRVRQETTPDAVGAGVLACADAWAGAIADGAGAEAWLAGLVLRLRALLRARPFSATAAAEVGAALVDGHLTDPDLLARTAEVLDQHLYTLAGADDADARTRLTLA